MRLGTLILVALAALGCRGATPPAEPGPPGQLAAGQDGLPVRLVENHAEWPADPFTFEKVTIAGKRLEIEVTFGGGCAEHDFELLIAPVFMESYPVQVRGRLSHDANGDMCRALLRRELAFDLTPLRDLYRTSYGIASDTLVLHLEGWSEAITYVF